MAERVMLSTVTLWPAGAAAVTGRGPRRGRDGRARGTALLALAAPVVFVVGLLAAQAAHPGPDAVDRSLSALAGEAASARWIMTLTLALVGGLTALVALGLRALPAPPRAVLGFGGVMLVVVAATPQPVGGTSVVHLVSGGLAWMGFTAFPLVVACSPGVGARLRWTSLATGAVLVALVAWFAAQFLTDGTWYGLSQRIAFIAQAVWPARVAFAATSRARGAPPPGSSDG